MMLDIIQHMTLRGIVFWSCLLSFFVGLACGGLLMWAAITQAIDKRTE